MIRFYFYAYEFFGEKQLICRILILLTRQYGVFFSGNDVQVVAFGTHWTVFSSESEAKLVVFDASENKVEVAKSRRS